MKRTLTYSIAAVLALSSGFLSGQGPPVPTLQFDSNANRLTMPDNIHRGARAGAATN
jgi:hypothetical protein